MAASLPEPMGGVCAVATAGPRAASVIAHTMGVIPAPGVRFFGFRLGELLDLSAVWFGDDRLTVIRNTRKKRNYSSKATAATDTIVSTDEKSDKRSTRRQPREANLR